MKNEITKSDKESFLDNSALFLEEFRSHFVDYFISLCGNYNCTVCKDDAREIALSIYQNVFKCDLDFEGLREDILIQMRHDGVMIGFLVNRSMFHIIQNYMNYMNKKEIVPQVEILIDCISKFINFLEEKVTTQVTSCIAQFDFNESDSIFINNNIIDMFQKLKTEGKTVTFLNLYQGVPISNEATIVNIDGENIAFKVDKLQEIAMKLDGNAFIIKNDYLGKHIKADIVYSNFLTNTVVLNNFIYLLNMPALQREYTRVHPDIIANVHLNQFGDIQTTGRLYDLSMSGLGVVSGENNGIFIGAKVRISFDLNSATQESKEQDNIEVEGTVINIIEYKGSYRYCMRIFPDKKMDKKIFNYIKQREKEIIENLKDELKEYVL